MINQEGKMNPDVEKHKIISEQEEKESKNRMVYITLKHNQIMEEIKAMAKAGIKHFKR